MMKSNSRNGKDRRSGLDRRTLKRLHLDNTHFLERRKAATERRSGYEPRDGYVHINQWKTAYLGVEIEETPAA